MHHDLTTFSGAWVPLHARMKTREMLQSSLTSLLELERLDSVLNTYLVARIAFRLFEQTE